MKIEQFLIENLNTPTAPAFVEIPEAQPEEFVVVDVTSDYTEEYDILGHCTVAIQAYSTSRLNAQSLMEDIINRVLALETNNKLCYIGINSAYPYNATESKKHRYQTVFDLTYYNKLI